MNFLKKNISRIIRVLHRVLIKINSKLKADNLPNYCPCCNTHLDHFIDEGFTTHPDRYNIERYEGIDQELICPVCASLPRHRILTSWMDNNVERFKDKKILYFAIEKSVRKWFNRHDIKCTTADLFNKADLALNIEDTGLEDGSFDVVVCNHVLEHVTDYKKALNELHRIIKDDGMIIISFPVDQSLDTVYEDKSITDPKDRLKCFGQADHMRVFGMDSPKILEDAGFIVTPISGDVCDAKIKPVVGPANYDYNVLWCLTKQQF